MQNHFMRLVLFTSLMCSAVMSLATATADIPSRWSKERVLFIQAEEALTERNLKQFETLKSQLTEYPLYPYLEYRYLLLHLDTQTPETIRQFYRAYLDTPLARRMYRRWLNELYKRKKWHHFLANYEDFADTELECKRRHALLQIGEKDQAIKEIEKIWLREKSQPKECDPVFATWRSTGGLTADLAWKRFEMAITAKQYRLAKYLKRYLDKSKLTIADAWLKAYQSPTTLLSEKHIEIPDQYLTAIVIQGIERIAYRDDEAAEQIWRTYETGLPFTALQQYKAFRAIGLGKVLDGHPEGYQWLVRIPAEYADRTTAEWTTRAALLETNWEHVLESIARMPEELALSNRWRYWKARAYEAAENSNEANPLYQELAAKRDFYGFISADRVGLPYRFQHKPIQVTSHARENVAQNKAVQRAHELLKLDRMIQARREWYYAGKQFNSDELLAAAQLAYEWNWSDRAIITLGQTNERDDLAMRFPLKHQQLVTLYADKRNLNPGWVYAIMRQESAFMYDARSHKGATGLMQLMPQTAKQVARKIGLRWRGSAVLKDPKTNIMLGTAYLSTALEHFDQHTALATASYNAGFHRVARWLPNKSHLDTDIWIETIPYSETRNYVQNVLAYMTVFEHRMGKKDYSLQEAMEPLPGKNNKTSSP